MLKAFSRYCKELADPVLKNRLLILDNITAFFSPSVNQKIDDIKKPLLKDLKQYVQIASWKDVNVFALKESAKRTHHQLNRLSLSLSVKDIIARYHENVPILSIFNLSFHYCDFGGI
jgi:midasin (ATPase involved in ribosome maturation)